jgi:hypothetical protein
LLSAVLAALLLLAGDGHPRAAEALPHVYPERTSGAGRLEYIQGLPVMFLSGTPEQIGRQHAELVGDIINPLLATPREVVAQHGYGNVWPLVVAMARVLVNNSPEEYRREIEAFIEAGGLDRDGIYVGNALVELRRIGGCSAFTVLAERSRTGEVIFGRNFDFPPFGVLDTHHCITVFRPQGKRSFASIGYPGMVGVISGINDAGLAVATLDVYESADGAPIFDARGVPLAITYRRILEECATLDEAEALLRSVPRTTYMNLAAADRNGAAVFEITPQTVGVRRPVDGGLACTNHFQLDGLSTHQQCRRIDRLNAINSRQATLGVADVQAALHAVNQGEMTLQTMVFEPRSLRLHVAMGGPGPVSNHPLKTFDLQELFAPRAELP